MLKVAFPEPPDLVRQSPRITMVQLRQGQTVSPILCFRKEDIEGGGADMMIAHTPTAWGILLTDVWAAVIKAGRTPKYVLLAVDDVDSWTFGHPTIRFESVGEA